MFLALKMFNKCFFNRKQTIYKLELLCIRKRRRPSLITLLFIKKTSNKLLSHLIVRKKKIMKKSVPEVLEMQI